MNLNIILNEVQDSTKIYSPGVQHIAQYYLVGGGRETLIIFNFRIIRSIFVGFLLVGDMEDTLLSVIAFDVAVNE